MNEPTPSRASRRSTIAIDLAKSMQQVAVSEEPGRVAAHHRLSRARMLEFFSRRAPAVVVMEACGSAHHWGRELGAMGHEVHLLPAQHVRKYRIGSKTDRRDAEAILEAHRRAGLSAVPVKSVEHQTIATLHRLRRGWMATRTARLNALRGALRELGMTVPVGANRVLPALREAALSGVLPEALVRVLSMVCDEVRELEARIQEIERQLALLTAADEVVRRLRTIPGIGLLTATALVVAMSDARRFRSSRHAASFVGLVPREHSSGDRRRLGAISKEGDTYLRTLLIGGARSVLWHARRQRDPDGLRAWALRLEASRGHNRAAVALAHRLVRIAWAVWVKGRDYEPQQATQ